MAGIDDGSLLGFIRGIHQRQVNRNIEDAERNYLTDPQAAIAAVNQVKGGGPEAAQVLRQRYIADQTAQTKLQQDQQTRYLGAVRNMAGMLGQARDSGGDIGAAFDTLAPVMKSGLGMSDDEIGQWKAKLTQNPSLIDALARDANAKLMNISAGAAVYDPNTRKEVYSNPGLTKPIQIRRGDGGVDLLIYDPAQRAFVQQGNAAPTGAPASGGAPAAGGGVGTNNPLNMRDPATGTFRNFATPQEGLAATQQQLARYFQTGKNTINSIVDGTGPKNPGWLGWPTNPGQDNSAESRANYKTLLQQRLGLGPNDPIPPARMNDLISAMSEAEGSTSRAASGGVAAPQPVYSTPGKPTKPGYHIATPEEKKAAGVDLDTPYQVSPDGKIEKIGERSAASQRSLGRAQPGQVVNYYKSLQSLKAEAARLLGSRDLDSAVGPIQSRIAGYYDKDAAQFQNDVGALGSKLGLQTINQLKELSKTGATGFGNLTEKEGELLREQLGSLKLNGSEEGLRRTLTNIEGWAQDQLDAMPPINNVPPKAIQYLRTHPDTKAQFDEHYGDGMSVIFLGK